MLHVHRLGQKILGTQLHGPHRGWHVGLTSQEDHRGVALPQVFQYLHAIHAGEPQIQDDDFGPQAVERGQAGLAAQLPGDLVAEPFEVVPDAAQNVDVVINEQDGAGHVVP